MTMLETQAQALRDEADGVVPAGTTEAQLAQRLSGTMAAVLAWHRPSRTLVLGRDPMGIKPLFTLPDEAPHVTIRPYNDTPPASDNAVSPSADQSTGHQEQGHQ